MKNKFGLIALIQFCLLGLISCGPNEYKCALDQKVILNLKNSYRLTLNTNETELLSSRYGEQFYKISSVYQESLSKNVRIDDLAFAYKDELYCCENCAEIVMNDRNKEVQEKRKKRRLIEIGDSLFQDSINRGLR
jgi:hypothetical protein